MTRGGHEQMKSRGYYLSSRIDLVCSDWLICEILTSPAIQEKGHLFPGSLFHSIIMAYEDMDHLCSTDILSS